MDTTNKTNVNASQFPGNTNDPSNRNFNAYLTLFSNLTANRFNTRDDYNNIDTNTIQRIAEFAISCTNVALNTWNNSNQSSTFKKTA